MSQPLFSIITVTYNAADTIEPTMKSVAEQTFNDYEHIIVDGMSADSTLSMVKSLCTEHTVINSERDNGIYDAMNRGIDRSLGKYLIFLNAGDSFHNKKTLSVIAEHIEQNDTPGIVYGQTILVGGKERKVTGHRHLRAPESLTYQSFANGMVVCHQAMAVLKRITCPYDTRYRFSADYDWAIKCLQHSRKNVYIDDILIDLDEGTTTRHLRASLLERFKIMCHHYGTASTIVRHFKFVARGAKRRLTTQSKQ